MKNILKDLSVFFVASFVLGGLVGVVHSTFIVADDTAHAEVSVVSEGQGVGSVVATSTIPEVPPAKLLFVGDIMLSRGIGNIMLKQNDWAYFVSEMGDFLSSYDLTFANLEGPISSRGVRSGSIYSFRADPRSVQALTRGGFDVVSVSNNHMWDYGRDALRDTMSVLDDAGVGFVGAGEDFAHAHTPLVRDIKGTRVAFLAYTDLLPRSIGVPGASPAVSLYTEEQAALDIAVAHKVADLVVVSFHWGTEYVTLHTAHQEAIGHKLVDMGADLVIGHHPHVPEDIETYQGKYIVYSLGNFIFDQNFSKDTSHGLAVEVSIKGKLFSDLKKYEIIFDKRFRPSLKGEGVE